MVGLLAHRASPGRPAPTSVVGLSIPEPGAPLMDPFGAAAAEEAVVAAVVVADAAGVGASVPGRARVGTLATQ